MLLDGGAQPPPRALSFPSTHADFLANTRGSYGQWKREEGGQREGVEG